jgi:hypothetical protein
MGADRRQAAGQVGRQSRLHGPQAEGRLAAAFPPVVRHAPTRPPRQPSRATWGLDVRERQTMRHFLAAAAARQAGLITVGLALSSSRADFCARYRSAARQPQELGLGTSHLGFRAC